MRLSAPALCFGGVGDASNRLSTALSCVFLRAEYYYDTGNLRIPLISTYMSYLCSLALRHETPLSVFCYKCLCLEGLLEVSGSNISSWVP